MVKCGLCWQSAPSQKKTQQVAGLVQSALQEKEPEADEEAYKRSGMRRKRMFRSLLVVAVVAVAIMMFFLVTAEIGNWAVSKDL